MWSDRIEVDSLKADGMIYTYITFSTEKGKTPYILVGKHLEEDPILEESPTKVEMKRW